jgi:hypothetical protein
MKRPNNLYLHEEIMLLVLKDKEGTMASGAHFTMAMGGAFLAELLLSKRISVATQKKKKFAELTDTTPFGDPLLDECLEKLKKAKRRQQLQTWVQRFSGLKNLKNRTAQQLIHRGILRADEDKIFLIFTRKIYPEVNPIPENELIQRLNDAIFTDATDIDPRTVVLLSIAKAADILKLEFDKKELKKRKQRIEKIVNGEMTGKATKEAIEAMQAAIMVAVIIPAVVAATSTASH